MSLDGTIIRVDPDTGVGLPGNPFASSADPNARRIIAYGLRNPFRFGLRPGTQQLWVGDVGWNTWEEINRVADVDDGVAENFGWPCYEGAGRQGGYDGANLNRCESLYAGAGQTGPFYTYDHGAQVVPGDACPTGSSSTTGIAFEDGSNYPADYDGALFFADAVAWLHLGDEARGRRGPGPGPDLARSSSAAAAWCRFSPAPAATSSTSTCGAARSTGWSTTAPTIPRPRSSRRARRRAVRR